MKKIFLFIFYTLILSVIGSCSYKGETSKVSDYKTAVKENNFERAHELLGEMHESFLNEYAENLSVDGPIDEFRTKIDAKASNLEDAYYYVYSSEVRFLISENSEGIEDKLLFMFNEIPIIGEKVQDGTRLTDNYFYEDMYLPKTKLMVYSQYVKTNNRLCDMIIDIAINSSSYKLAMTALNHYQDNVDFNKTDQEGYLIAAYNHKDKDNAEAKINEAVKNGLISKE